MFANMKFWETDAQAKGYAVPHFNVWNMEMLQGALDAAAELHSPVIISMGTGFLQNTVFENYAPAMVKAAKDAPVPVILHWDHGRSFDIVKHAYAMGMNSVMIDKSAEDFETNIRLTQEVVDHFHPMGVPVEAELGHVGNETVYEEALAHYKYTDPDQAAEFVKRTGCDSLAVAIGNQHGVYTSPPKLNFDVVRKVRQAVSVPLVLHGASGIRDEDIKTAISLGIAKINIHTELCEAAMQAVAANPGTTFLDLEQKVRAAIKQRAMEKILLFGSDGKADR
jgi:ketose-bisphosphate aldolase